MKVFNLTIGGLSLMVAVAGCTTVQAKRAEPDPEGAELTLNDGGLKIKASDGDGSKFDLEVDSNGARISGRDQDGSRAELLADKEGVVMEARGATDGKFSLKADSKGLDARGLGKEDGSFSLHADKDDFSLKAQGDGGSFENNANVSEADLGRQFYPGSKAVPMATFIAKSKSEDVWCSTRTTEDEPGKIIDFYEGAAGTGGKSISRSDLDGRIEQELKFKDSAGARVEVKAVREKGAHSTTVTVVRAVDKN